MPKPTKSNQRYMPGLDGLRAVAVIAVIAYHLGFGWMPGGLLGVGVFFTLSGYLITDILLSHHRESGTLGLGDFWLRRARRLLPALFLMLAVVVVWVAVIEPSRMAELRGEVFAALLYVSNWWYIFNDVSYFANFGPPPTLGHLWSLAVEEQFYVVWPILLLLGVRFTGGYSRLALITVVLSASSATLMAVMYVPGTDPTRIYDGTDTRAFGLLAGAALAMVWPSRRLSAHFTTRRDGFLLSGVGAVGLSGILLMFFLTDQYSGFLYRGGIVLLTVATLLVVASVAHPAARFGAVLGCLPLRWIGVRSYGIYLWHYPIIILTSPAMQQDTTLSLKLFQVALTVVAASLSWQLVEEPVRRGAIERFWTRLRSVGQRSTSSSRRNWIPLAGTLGVTALAIATMAGLLGNNSGSSAMTPPPGESGARIEVTAPGISDTQDISVEPATRNNTTMSAETTGTPSEETTSETKPVSRTSCEAVAYIGDSTSEGMVSEDHLLRAKHRLDARYARVGATTQSLDISGARSVVETLPGQVGGFDAAQAIRAEGFSGCWVIALGGNDTANVFMGSQSSLEDRIEQMMSVVDDDPVLWVTVRTLLDSGPYAQDNMQLWNDAIIESCDKYPDMKVYDWASATKDEWFTEDGTHFTSEGYFHRARLNANALAEAFPESGDKSPDCVVE